MQTLLLIWTVSSVAIFAAVLIVTSGGKEPPTMRVAVLAAFWPPILTGLLVSFASWCIRKAIEARAAPVVAP